MSEKRHRSSGGSRKKQVLVWLAWGVLIALLGSNLVMFLLKQDASGESGEGFITIELLQTVGFWAPIAAAWTFSLLGLFWASKAYKHSERSSLLWAKRGYAFAIVAALAFVIAAFEPEILDRRWFSVVGALVIGGQSVFFALLARSEYRRAETGEGTRHPRRSGERAPVSALPPTPAGPAESPGAGR